MAEIKDQFSIQSRLPTSQLPLINELPRYGLHLTANPLTYVLGKGRTSRQRVVFKIALFQEDTTHLPAFIGTTGPEGRLLGAGGYRHIEGLATADYEKVPFLLNFRTPNTLNIGFDLNSITSLTNLQVNEDGGAPTAKALRSTMPPITSVSLGEWVSKQKDLTDAYLPAATDVEKARFVKLRTLALATLPAAPVVTTVPKYPGGWVPKPPAPEAPDWHSLASWVQAPNFNFREIYWLWLLGVDVAERGELAGLPADLLLDMVQNQYDIDPTTIQN